MEKGLLPIEYKGKSLEEIPIEDIMEHPEEDDEGILSLTYLK